MTSDHDKTPHNLPDMLADEEDDGNERGWAVLIFLVLAAIHIVLAMFIFFPA